MYKILKKQKIGQDIYELQIQAPHIVKYAKPGNFVIIRNGKGKGMTFPLADYNRKSISVVFQSNGKDTRELAKLRKGNFLADIAGPLGNPSNIDEFGRVCLIAEDMGCVSTYLISKALKKKGNEIINIISAKTKDKLVWPDKFDEVSDKLFVCTRDGSMGEKCPVTKPLENLIRNNYFNRVLAVGSVEMMSETARLTYQRARTYVHLFPATSDGLGICGGCRINVGGETRLACMDGPEFDAHEVDFDALKRKRFHQH